MSQLKQSGRKGQILSFSIFLFSDLQGSAQSTRGGQTAYQVHWFKCWPHPESPSQTHSEIPGHNVIQLSWNTSNPSIKFLFPTVIFSSRNSFFVIVSNSRLKSPFLSFNFLFMLMTVVSKGVSLIITIFRFPMGLFLLNFLNLGLENFYLFMFLKSIGRWV